MVARFIGCGFSSSARLEHIPDGRVKPGGGLRRHRMDRPGLIHRGAGAAPRQLRKSRNGLNCQLPAEFGRHGAFALSESRRECRRYEADRRFFAI